MTSDAYDVINYGTDTSGRSILMNRRMYAALVEAFRHFDDPPLITQGAYMARIGGGAPGSAGYHDKGGCLDFRVWDLADHGLDIGQAVHALRWTGWAAWHRNVEHGGFTDPHIHAVLLGDTDAADGALLQMQQYRDGLDGMYGADYHARPDPIRTFNYPKWLREQDDMALDDKVNDEHTVKQVLNRLDRYITNSATRLVDIREQLEKLVAEVAALPDGTSVAKTREVVRRNADAIKAHMDELDQDEPPPMKPPVPEEIPA